MANMKKKVSSIFFRNTIFSRYFARVFHFSIFCLVLIFYLSPKIKMSRKFWALEGKQSVESSLQQKVEINIDFFFIRDFHLKFPRALWLSTQTCCSSGEGNFNEINFSFSSCSFTQIYLFRSHSWFDFKLLMLLPSFYPQIIIFLKGGEGGR